VYSSQDLPQNNAYQERYVARDLDAERNSSAKRIVRATPGRPSIGRRIFRTLSRFFFTVLLGVAATLAWQSYGDEAREMVSAWAPSLALLLPVSTTTSPVAASTLPRVVQQLEPMAHDIAVVRHSLEQLAAKQEQMALHIAALNAVEKLSSSAPSWAVPILSSKPPQPAARAPSSSPPARQPLVLDRVGGR
jgi:hypothetical protein